MKLAPDQQRVLNRILSIGRARGASPMEIKAAVETGLVESNLRNLPGGDRDSQGWRQERASLYKDPTNLDASINRFYDEVRANRGKYGRAGDLAAAVQRPAAQYRGRYQERSQQADALAGSDTRIDTGAPRSAQSDPADKGALLKQYLATRNQPGALLSLAAGLKQEAPQAARSATQSGAQGSTQGRSKLLEMFWQGDGGVNVKNGQLVPQGFVSGHTDHVHVAAGPKTILQLAKLAQSMGLDVGENPAYGGVAPVHAKNSYHDRTHNVGGREVGQAIDVSGDPAKMREYAHRVARSYGLL